MSDLISISRALSDDVGKMRFGGQVDVVYNPLEYAREPHELYLRRYGHRAEDTGALTAPPPGRALLVGMNPGPFGMGQTGVPFGAIPAVRDWMGIEAPVAVPAHTHPKRPVEGFAHKRVEGSGKRLWGWAEERFGAAENFFDRFFVHNLVPLFFVHESGRNLTPDKLLKEERDPLLERCDQALRAIVDVLQPALVIGVGVFAEDRARKALSGSDIPIGRVLHPSPASPKANQGWAEQAEAELRELGVDLPD